MFAGYCMDFIGRTHLSITFESRKVNHAPRNSKCGRSAPPKLPAAFPWQICHRLSPEHPSDLLTQRWNQKYSSNLGNISEKQKDKKYSYSFFARVFLFLGTKEWLRETGGGGGKEGLFRCKAIISSPRKSDNFELDSCTGMIPWLFNDSPPRSSKR